MTTGVLAANNKYNGSTGITANIFFVFDFQRFICGCVTGCLAGLQNADRSVT